MKALASWQALALRSAGRLVAPGGAHGSLVVLIYHRVLPVPDPLLPSEPDEAIFAAQMDLLKTLCNVLPLREAIERLETGTLPARAACITFDDGYANNRTIAAPILAERRLPATVFIATDFIAGGRMWNDTVIECVRKAPDELDLAEIGLRRFALTDVVSRRGAIKEILDALRYRDLDERRRAVDTIAERASQSLPTDMMMTERQIKELSSLGVEAGAHTMGHPILARIDAPTAAREVVGSKGVLEEILGCRVRTFAYPNGRPGRDYDRSHVEIVRRAGFELAVSTAWGAAGRAADRYQIPRALPWDRDPFRFSMRLLQIHRQRQAAIAV